MFKRVLAVVLVAVTTSICGAHQFQSNEDQARIQVAKSGFGKDARVEVQLNDNTRVKGYINKTDADSFTLIDGSGTSIKIAFADVKKINRSSNGFWTRTKLITAAAVGAGAIVTWIIVKPALCDGGAQSRGPC